MKFLNDIDWGGVITGALGVALGFLIVRAFDYGMMKAREAKSKAAAKAA